MTKIHPKKLLVEGREEMRVIPELAEAHGISWGEKKDTAIIYIIPFFFILGRYLAPRCRGGRGGVRGEGN